MPNKTSNDYFAFCIFCSVCVFIMYLCCWFSYIYILYFFRFHPFLVDLSSQILYYFSFLSCIHIILLLAFVFFFISFYSRSLYFFCCWYHNFSSRAFFSLRIIILFIFFSFLHFCVIHIHNVIYIFFLMRLLPVSHFFSYSTCIWKIHFHRHYVPYWNRRGIGNMVLFFPRIFALILHVISIITISFSVLRTMQKLFDDGLIAS